MKVIASCVRGMLVAAPGHQLQSIDYAGIESRANAWLFGETWKVQAFRDFDAGVGPDLYKVSYARSFSMNPAAVLKSQRQIGKVQELALGYEGGVGAFVTMAAAYGIDLDELARAAMPGLPQAALESAAWMWENYAVAKGSTHGLSRDTFVAIDALKKLWRDAHPRISEGWKLLRDAAILAVENPGSVFGLPNRKIMFKVSGDWLQMRLPSGRRLSYYKPEVHGEDKGKHLTYMGVDTYTRRWCRTSTYGGKLCENAVQAISRDLLVHGLRGLEAAGVETIGTVHDEVISEVNVSSPTLEECQRVFCRLPSWAKDFPLAAEGWRAPRYKK